MQDSQEVPKEGRLRLHETWVWTGGDCSKGESIVEAMKEDSIQQY